MINGDDDDVVIFDHRDCGQKGAEIARIDRTAKSHAGLHSVYLEANVNGGCHEIRGSEVV